MSSQTPEHLKATIAANIDAAIAADGRTNRAVGEAMGAAETQVWKWRRGKTGISQGNLLKLAEVLEQDAGWFYTDHSPVIA